MQLVEESQDGWHTDGNAQFVVVVMLSDPTNMLGGETEVRCGDGSVRKITYPAAGYAVMLQVRWLPYLLDIPSLMYSSNHPIDTIPQVLLSALPRQQSNLKNFWTQPP